jgi:hypothetical protein
MSEPDEKAVLAGWAGLMRSGSVRTHVNMNYSFLFRIKLQEATSGARETPISPQKIGHRLHLPRAPTRRRTLNHYEQK